MSIKSLPRLVYFELHVDDQTFYVHAVVNAHSPDEAMNKIKDIYGEHYHLQVKGYLGIATKTNMIKWLKAGIPVEAQVK